ncbi:TIP41-like family-domain-containing protein [Entophlyctis helioformis]|nr:TIP41-like family-domain-containing protein [Entophlyctis helioformis]
MASGAQARPQAAPHRLFEADGGSTKGIAIGDWRLSTTKRPICNASELDRVAEQVAIPLPEMLFGNNRLAIEHRCGLLVSLDAVSALARVDNRPEAADRIKVACAAQWSKNSSNTHEKIRDIIKPYDWTYSTEHRGLVTVVGKAAREGGNGNGIEGESGAQLEMVPSDVGINIQQLLKPEPILFYDELVLFEDELADNGVALLSLRVRVMPSCFLVLQRFFLRVDGVMFRVIDTRYYHEFGSDVLIREFHSREAPYDAIRKRLPWTRDPVAAPVQDLSMLTDTNWVTAQVEKETPMPTLHLRESLSLLSLSA